MVYSTFSTGKADYILQLGNHIFSNDWCGFDGIDGLVIEHSNGQYFKDIVEDRNDRQMGKALEFCKTNDLPIFGADVDLTPIGEIRALTTYPYESGLALPLTILKLYSSFSDERFNPKLSKLCSNVSYIFQNLAVEGRNAMNARKIEEYIIPMISKNLKKERSKIGLIFGMGHTGLEHDLKSKRRRDFTIWNMERFNICKYGGFDREELNSIYEARYNRDHWEFVKHKINLF